MLDILKINSLIQVYLENQSQLKSFACMFLKLRWGYIQRWVFVLVCFFLPGASYFCP